MDVPGTSQEIGPKGLDASEPVELVSKESIDPKNTTHTGFMHVILGRCHVHVEGVDGDDIGHPLVMLHEPSVSHNQHGLQLSNATLSDTKLFSLSFER